MKLSYAFFLAQSVGVMALAETPMPGPSTGPAAPSRGVQVFDDRIFQLSGDKKEPTTTKSGDGTERYLADQPDYNSQTREQAMEMCAPMREKDQKGYKDCFQKQMKQSKEEVKRRMSTVEERQKQPLRNTGPIEDPPKKGNPVIPEIQIQQD